MQGIEVVGIDFQHALKYPLRVPKLLLLKQGRSFIELSPEVRHIGSFSSTNLWSRRSRNVHFSWASQPSIPLLQRWPNWLTSQPNPTLGKPFTVLAIVASSGKVFAAAG